MGTLIFLFSLATAIHKEEQSGFEEDVQPTFFSLLVMGFLIFVLMAATVAMVMLP